MVITTQGGSAAGGVNNVVRWSQIVFGVICMMAAANVQYAWTLFVPEIQSQFGWQRAAIQTTFTIFVLVQTWLTPVWGYLIDKYGPRMMVFVGGFFVGVSWIVDSYATSLLQFYIGAAIGGVGVGAVYATCINNAIKWFPDRRGLAIGLTAGGFGAGSALTIIPIANVISSSGYQTAFFWFGLAQGLVIMLAATRLRAPITGETKASDSLTQTRHDYTLGEALRTPLFYLLFTMFVLTVTGGLMAVSQLGPLAEDVGVKDQEINLGFFAMAALPFALFLDRIMNGLSRPLFGWISDHIGRENTMFIAFGLEGVGIIMLANFAHIPWAFVILSGLVFFAWGEVYSLFSATAADAFGTKHIGSIYGVLYCAKGVAALLVPVANLVMEATGTWTTVLYTVASMDLLSAFCALLLLKPLLRRHNAATEAIALRPAPSVA